MKDNVNKAGWKVAWHIYPNGNWYKKIWRPITLTAIMSVAALCGHADYIELMKKTASWITGGYPSILGFILSGYVLLIGFGDSDFLLTLAKTPEDDEVTLFQKVSSTFSIVLLVILSVYGIGALYDFVIECAIAWPFGYCECMRNIYNFSALVTLLFVFSYSLFTMFDIVINIFNMGQVANVMVKKKLAQIKNEEENKDERKSLWQIVMGLLGVSKVSD